MLGFLTIAGPLDYLPNIFSAQWLFGNTQAALGLLVRPLPIRAAITSFVFFPLSQAIVEIPTYVLAAVPRIEALGVRPWLAVSLAGLFLSLQHIFVPFIPDLRYIAYRMIMFMPFAILIVIILHWRPRLMPYLAVVHFLMDLSISIMILINNL